MTEAPAMIERACKDCGVQILIAPITTKEGVEKHHPFDKKPVMRFVKRPDGRWNIGYTYCSHFETCVHADDWRDTKKKESSE